jgi:hypothetical protein
MRDQLGVQYSSDNSIGPLCAITGFWYRYLGRLQVGVGWL